MKIDEELTKIEHCKVESLLSAFGLCLQVRDVRAHLSRTWRAINIDIARLGVQYQFPTALFPDTIVYCMVTWYKCTNGN